ncbi:MAG: hypothetical protein M0R41_05265 [Methylobacter tundripaludum]|nr:hypothetical protein [Methylobacter tundripaludum]
MVRQAHHERNQQFTVRPEPVKDLISASIALNLTFIGFSIADHSNAADNFNTYQGMQTVVNKSQSTVLGAQPQKTVFT